MIATLLCAVALSAICRPGGTGEQNAASAQRLHDPFVRLAQDVEDAGRLLDAFRVYDADALLSMVRRIAERSEREATDLDPYLFAQGVLDLTWIRRFYERIDEEPPGALRSFDVDAWTERALERAERFAERHPDHSDIQRAIGDLHAARIRGMARGLIEGPKAKRAVDRALEIDPENARAVLALARMHYHNPPFAGGDKDEALKEFRRVARDTGDLRALLYLARLYLERGLSSQARFFVEKAHRAAPDNPEVRWLRGRLGGGADGERR